MWKAPNRPNKVISQTFNDGTVAIYSIKDTAQPGYKPKEMAIKETVLRFEERRLGIERFYQGQQNQVEISRVIRAPRHEKVNTQQIAVIKGVQYRINLIQHAPDVYPPCMDLTLAAIQQEYKLEEENADLV